MFAYGKYVSSVESLTRRVSYLGFVFTSIVGHVAVSLRIDANLSPFIFALDKESHGTISMKHVISKYRRTSQIDVDL